MSRHIKNLSHKYFEEEIDKYENMNYFDLLELANKIGIGIDRKINKSKLIVMIQRERGD